MRTFCKKGFKNTLWIYGFILKRVNIFLNNNVYHCFECEPQCNKLRLKIMVYRVDKKMFGPEI
jgi:hypothetical protein